MARKRPSLRNYLTEGDDARDIDVPASPPSSVPARKEFVDDLLKECPTGKLSPEEWAVAAMCVLFRWKGVDVSSDLLKERFRDQCGTSMDPTIEGLKRRNVLSMDGDGLEAVDSALWSDFDYATSDRTSSENADDVRSEFGLTDIMREEDRALWGPMLESRSADTLSISDMKARFDKADLVTTQFYVLRKVGEKLVPVTKSSQIRIPIKAMLVWSESAGAEIYLES